jgi:hypothetical protein
VPQELGNLLNSAGGTIATLQPILQTIKSLLQVAEAFYHGSLDPLSTVVQALLTEVENLVNDFFATGVYTLVVDPINRPGIVKYDSLGIPLMTPGQAIFTALDSLDDKGDPARPQFSDDAQVSGIGLLASAPTVDQFLTLITQLSGIFTIPQWELVFKIAKRHTRTPAVPTPPDWQSLRLNSIAEMKELQDVLLALTQMLRGYAVVPNTNIQDLINIINTKISKLQDILNTMNSLISGLQNTTGIFVMNMPIDVGGNNRIKTYLRDCPMERSTNQYSIMALFIGGGASLQPVDKMRRMMV